MSEKRKFVLVSAIESARNTSIEIDATSRGVRVPKGYEQTEYIIERRGPAGSFDLERPILVFDDFGDPFPFTGLVSLGDCAIGERVFALLYNDPPGQNTRIWLKWEVMSPLDAPDDDVSDEAQQRRLHPMDALDPAHGGIDPYEARDAAIDPYDGRDPKKGGIDPYGS